MKYSGIVMALLLLTPPVIGAGPVDFDGQSMSPTQNGLSEMTKELREAAVGRNDISAVPAASPLLREGARQQIAAEDEFTYKELPRQFYNSSNSPVILDGRKYWDFRDEQLSYDSEAEAAAAMSKWLVIFKASGIEAAKSEVTSYTYSGGAKKYWFAIKYPSDEYIEVFYPEVISEHSFYDNKADARNAMEKSVVILNKNGVKVFYATTVLANSGYTYYIYYFTKYDPERVHEKKVRGFRNSRDFTSSPPNEAAMVKCRSVFEKAGVPLVSIDAVSYKSGDNGMYGYLTYYIGKYSDIIHDYKEGFWFKSSAEKAMEKHIASLGQSGDYVIEGSVFSYHGGIGTGYSYSVTRLAR